jgi:excisionase family DNA binding protein
MRRSWIWTLSLRRSGAQALRRSGAQALGVTRRHVQRLVSERRIPLIKVGRFVRFDPASLNVWLDDQLMEAERGTPREYAPWR